MPSTAVQATSPPTTTGSPVVMGRVATRRCRWCRFSVRCFASAYA